MTDNLDAAIAELRRVTDVSAMEGFGGRWTGHDFCHEQSAHDPDPIDDAIAEILNAVLSGRLSRAALAAAPQPVAVMQYYYKDNACPAEHSRTETCICWHDEGKGPFPDLKNGDAIPMAYGSAIGLTWRAAPQPASEQGMTRAEVGQMLDAKRHDREALVEVIKDELWLVRSAQEMAEHAADALLARGLRLPSVVSHEPASGETQAPLPVTDDTQTAPETMAWAVVGSDGKMVAINYDRMTAQHLCNPGERIVRIAIRVMEGGDDEQ